MFFKFKSQKEPSRVTFDGTGITVFDLKREIITINRLGDGSDFNLAIYNQDTNEGEFLLLGWVVDSMLTALIRIQGRHYSDPEIDFHYSPTTPTVKARERYSTAICHIKDAQLNPECSTHRERIFQRQSGCQEGRTHKQCCSYTWFCFSRRRRLRGGQDCSYVSGK